MRENGERGFDLAAFCMSTSVMLLSSCCHLVVILWSVYVGVYNERIVFVHGE